MNDKPKLNWNVVKEFEENGILVEVSASDATRTRYTVRIGRRGERGSIPFLPLYTIGQGKVSVVSVVETVSKLLLQAEKFVEEQAQVQEDAYLSERIERESRQVEREGKKRRGPQYKGART